VRSTSDRHPGYALPRGTKAKSAQAIGNLAPWLPEKLLGEVRLLTYVARDGLKLDAYVTLPLNYAAGKPVPMIVLPHGGPWCARHLGLRP